VSMGEGGGFRARNGVGSTGFRFPVNAESALAGEQAATAASVAVERAGDDTGVQGRGRDARRHAARGSLFWPWKVGSSYLCNNRLGASWQRAASMTSPA